jgi:LuxR family maltose regulon positive regulatory protein
MRALRDRLNDPRTSGRGATWHGHYLYMHFRVAAILDDDETQRELAAQLAAYRNPTERAVFVRQRGSLPGRLAALDGRWGAAASGISEALQDEIALDHYGQASELRLRLAEALVRLGRLDDAAQALRPALARAAASGEMAPLRFAGRRVLRTLCAASWGTRLTIDAQALLREAGVATPSAGSTAATDDGDDDGLTLREREVLSNIAAGASNKLIARALDLSPHTVKRHVANILGKLGLATRGEAAAWWRAQRAR